MFFTSLPPRSNDSRELAACPAPPAGRGAIDDRAGDGRGQRGVRRVRERRGPTTFWALQPARRRRSIPRRIQALCIGSVLTGEEDRVVRSGEPAVSRRTDAAWFQCRALRDGSRGRPLARRHRQRSGGHRGGSWGSDDRVRPQHASPEPLHRLKRVFGGTAAFALGTNRMSPD